MCLHMKCVSVCVCVHDKNLKVFWSNINDVLNHLPNLSMYRRQFSFRKPQLFILITDISNFKCTHKVPLQI